MSIEAPAQLVSVDEFVTGLCTIPEEDFRPGKVYDYLASHPVDERSIEQYLIFSKKHYTRNLIFKNDLFELVAVCWEVGQASQIHNHHNQNCWMSIPIGRLRVQNFHVLEQKDDAGYCRLEPTEAFDIHKYIPAEVDPAEPVHQVLNLAEFNQRAVSLHIYSRPFDQCRVYCLETSEYREIPLHYTTEYGKLCEGEKL
jgi:predicted metal-dependent enzyme (double-stranded beta helix superfamily)